jgi:hypothetical protein
LDAAGRLFALLERAFGFAERALAFLLLDFFAVDFFAPDLPALLKRVDFTARFAAGAAARTVFATAFAALTVCRAVRLTAGRSGLFSSARFPSTAPITPPTIAPTGPATAPTTAPVAAPAVGLEMGGMSMSLSEEGFVTVVDDFFAIGFVVMLSRKTIASGQSNCDSALALPAAGSRLTKKSALVSRGAFWKNICWLV